MTVEDGWLTIPDRPGLGIEFNEEAAAEHPYKPVDLYDLHRPGGSQQKPVKEFRHRLR